MFIQILQSNTNGYFLIFFVELQTSEVPPSLLKRVYLCVCVRLNIETKFGINKETQCRRPNIQTKFDFLTLYTVICSSLEAIGVNRLAPVSCFGFNGGDPFPDAHELECCPSHCFCDNYCSLKSKQAIIVWLKKVK